MVETGELRPSDDAEEGEQKTMKWKKQIDGSREPDIFFGNESGFNSHTSMKNN